MLVACQNCEKEINIPPSRLKERKGKYCNRKCRYETELKPNQICKACNKKFHTTPSSLKKGWGNFCCTVCWKKSRPKIEIKCKNCDVKMIISVARFKEKRGIFCSKQCQYSSMKNKIKCDDSLKEFFNISSKKYVHIFRSVLIDKKCKVCGLYFKVQPSRIREGKGKLCSRLCADKYKTKSAIDNFFKRVNYDSNQIKGKSDLDITWSKNIKNRDKNCQICNKPVKNAHHIFYRQFYPLLRFNENNGIGLCILCHWQSHGKKLLLQVV